MWGSPSQQDVEGSCDKHALLALTVFRAPGKRIFLFSCGATPSRTVPKTQQGYLFSTRKSRLGCRCQKEGIWGKTIAGVRVGWTGPKIGEIGCAKKGGRGLLVWRQERHPTLVWLDICMLAIKAQLTSHQPQPPKECDLESAWSYQASSLLQVPEAYSLESQGRGLAYHASGPRRHTAAPRDLHYCCCGLGDRPYGQRILGHRMR